MLRAPNSAALRHRILVVDEEQGPREALRMVLAPEHEVIVAGSAARALEILQERDVELVTLDLHRPGSEGPALLSRIRTQWPDVQVIVITGHGDLATAVHGLRHGVADYLAKPFDVGEVAAAVRRALARRPQPAATPERRGTAAAFLIRLAETAELQVGAFCGHARRVACYAAALAERAGVAPAEQQRLWLAGMVHDLGKLGVPAEILARPGPLRLAERSFVERHPLIGEQLLAPLAIDAQVARVVRHHHEWWNGRGYPDGIRGAAIPFEARIVQLADVWDAMTSDRPYRAALSKQAAIDELERSAGHQLDPELTKEMIALVEGEALVHEIALDAIESVSDVVLDRRARARGSESAAPSAWSPILEDSTCPHSESSSRSISGGV